MVGLGFSGTPARLRVNIRYLREPRMGGGGVFAAGQHLWARLTGLGDNLGALGTPGVLNGSRTVRDTGSSRGGYEPTGRRNAIEQNRFVLR